MGASEADEPGAAYSAGAALCLIWTKAMRIWARASRSVATSGPEPVAEPLDQAGEGVDGQGRGHQVGRRRREVDGGQLVQPHGVVDHDDLGRYLGQPGRASSISARSAASSRLSSSSPMTSPASSGARSGREPAPPEPSVSRRSPTGCSPPGVQRLLTPLTYPGQLNSKRGPAGLAGTRPPPGHPSEHLERGRRGRASGRCSRRSRRPDPHGSACGDGRCDVGLVLGVGTHRFPGGAAHCAGVSGHSHAPTSLGSTTASGPVRSASSARTASRSASSRCPRPCRWPGELDLDLVEVAPLANPPVCRIMDFGKYKYEEAQRAKESRRKAPTSPSRR